MKLFTNFFPSILIICQLVIGFIIAQDDLQHPMPRRLLQLLQTRFPQLFDPDVDMVKRYNSVYAFGLGKRMPDSYYLINPSSENEYGTLQNVINDPEDTIDSNDAIKRENSKYSKYSFGIGKRSKEPKADIGKTPISGFNFGLGKRSSIPKMLDDRDRELLESPLYENYHFFSNDAENKRAKNPYSFGLGKRSTGDYEFGLGKRARGDYGFGLGKRARGDYGFGLGKRASGDYEFGLGKRARGDYEFGLGKRARGDYEFGLGKRARGDYEFGLGKRARGDYEFGLGKRARGDYEFGLGKRARGDYEFGLGKRARGDYEFGLGKRGMGDYEFGLGKRARGDYEFGLGKRATGDYEFGLGKRGRGPYSFGLGKRGRGDYSFGLGKRDYFDDSYLYDNDPIPSFPILSERILNFNDARDNKNLNKKSRNSYEFGLGKRSISPADQDDINSEEKIDTNHLSDKEHINHS